ncbi:unnamed protein product [Thlaspi arvense]|uniref:Uncharacterized protein n=1 Tax=Thlaspi arvense TaxID=13288 RepID=A0AAU9SXY1_THLAR|nr:unnamed protein product [Thlaspi arvense]
MDLEAESDPHLMAALLFFKIIPMGDSDLSDSQESEPVLELQSLIATKIPLDQLKRELISHIQHIYSIVVSPESKSKWEQKPKDLICLSSQWQLLFDQGIFSVTGKVEWSSESNEECWFNERKQGIYFLCRNCNGKYHQEYQKAPVEINHHLHPKHHLQLATAGLLDRSRECYCCDRDLLWVFYYCSACDFAMNVACVERPPLLLAIDHPKWHEHTLALFTRPAPLNCSLCALPDLSSPVYMCPPCGFVEIGLAVFVAERSTMAMEAILASRMVGCSYAAHSKCATQSNVWDGIEIEGEPEEVEDEEDVLEPFVRISDGIIQHFSHGHHHLRLDDNTGGDYDDNKQCQACITPIYFGSFYSCTQCDFILHEACANLSRKIYHPIHPHQLTLVGEHDAGTNDYNICAACPTYCTGFSYKCSKEGCLFKIHVQCATISEPLVHESHTHPLFLTSKPGEWRTCTVCKDYLYNDRETFNCIECDFALCFACATLPQKVRYKYDKHVLTLSYEEETSSTAYWCEACEKEINTKERFYTCGEHCCVTLHVECLLGRTFYMRPGSSFPCSSKRYDVVRNNHMSRPICDRCVGLAEAKVGVNKPELLPKEFTSVIDVAGFLSDGQEKRIASEIADLEKDTGFKLRVLAQNYPVTPGLAIKDFWQVDDSTIVFVADPTFGNILNFNVGATVDLDIPRSFWSRLAGKYGNMFYWKDKARRNHNNTLYLCILVMPLLIVTNIRIVLKPG